MHRPHHDLLWLFESVEAKRDVVAKEAWRRSVPFVHSLSQVQPRQPASTFGSAELACVW